MKALVLKKIEKSFPLVRIKNNTGAVYDSLVLGASYVSIFFLINLMFLR